MLKLLFWAAFAIAVLMGMSSVLAALLDLLFSIGGLAAVILFGLVVLAMDRNNRDPPES